MDSWRAFHSGTGEIHQRARSTQGHTTVGAINTPDLKRQREQSQETGENHSREEDLLAEAMVVKGYNHCQETLPRAERKWGGDTVTPLFPCPTFLGSCWPLAKSNQSPKNKGAPKRWPRAQSRRTGEWNGPAGDGSEAKRLTSTRRCCRVMGRVLEALDSCHSLLCHWEDKSSFWASVS